MGRLRKRWLLIASSVVALALGPVLGSAPSGAVTPQPPGLSRDDATQVSPHLEGTNAKPTFPDPGLLYANGKYYIYATNRPFNVMSSPDWDHGFSNLHGALDEASLNGSDISTSSTAAFMAPHVFESSPGKFVMWFAGTSTISGKTCIAVATASSPDGPFEMAGNHGILHCATNDLASVIDPAMYVDNAGNRYLIYKRINANDFKDPRTGDYCPSSGPGNAGHTNEIDAFPVNDDGLSVKSGTVGFKLVKRCGNIEAPSVVKSPDPDGGVYLFVSRGNFRNCSYQEEIWHNQTFRPTSTDPDYGPFTYIRTMSTKDREGTDLCGQGGAEVINTPYGYRMAFHAWQNRACLGQGDDCDARDHGDYRVAFMGRIEWSNGPYIPPAP